MPAPPVLRRVFIVRRTSFLARSPLSFQALLDALPTRSDGFPLFSGPLMLLAVLLLLGHACGEVAKRLGLPRLTGYLLLGLLLGDTGTGWLDAGARALLRPFVDVGLALLLLELGQRLDLHWMRRERWLAVMAIGEIALTWLLAFTALKLFDFTHAEAAFLAAVVISTSPVVLMSMAREDGADGQVSNRVMALTALNSLAAFVLATLLLPVLHYERDDGAIATLVLHAAWRLVGSMLLGVLVFGLFRFCARWYSKRPQARFVLALGMAILAVGLADALDVSVLCAMLTMGVLVKNADPHRRIGNVGFGFTSEVLCVILFIVAGASAHFSTAPAVIGAATALVALRLVAKMLPILAIAPLTPLGLSRAGLVGLALTPLSGFTALVLIDPAAAGFASDGRLIAVFLTAVAMLEVVGPLLVQFAFRRARETHGPDEA